MTDREQDRRYVSALAEVLRAEKEEARISQSLHRARGHTAKVRIALDELTRAMVGQKIVRTAEQQERLTRLHQEATKIVGRE